MLAHINVIVLAPTDKAGGLTRTFESLVATGYPKLDVVIVAEPDAVELAKAARGVPHSVLLADGKLCKADAYNAALQDSQSDIVVFLEAGDEVYPDYPYKVHDAFAEGVGVIGAVICDQIENSQRVFEEPCSRERVRTRFWEPPLAVARYANPRFTELVAGETYELILRLYEEFLVIHIPEVLLKVWRKTSP